MIIALFMWGNTRLNRVFFKLFGFAARNIVGIKQVVLHEERLYAERPTVIIGNHQTALDLAVIGSLCPTRSVVVAKKEIQYIPLFGWFFRAAGNILIDRSKSDDAKKLINRVTTTLRQQNLNLVVFPEGTRNRHREQDELMLPFKKGAFFLAVNTKLPLVPVVCSTMRGKAVWENFDLAGGILVISVLEPMETKDLAPNQVDAFRNRVRTLMMDELKRLNSLAEEYTSDAKKSGRQGCSGDCH